MIFSSVLIYIMGNIPMYLFSAILTITFVIARDSVFDRLDLIFIIMATSVLMVLTALASMKMMTLLNDDFLFIGTNITLLHRIVIIQDCLGQVAYSIGFIWLNNKNKSKVPE